MKSTRPRLTSVSVSTALAMHLDFSTYRPAARRGHYDRPQTDPTQNSTDRIGEALQGNEEIELKDTGSEDRKGLLRK